MEWKERYTMAHRSFWKNRNMERVQETMIMEGDFIVPVSYTHLDVYKRQVVRYGGDEFVIVLWGIPKNIFERKLAEIQKKVKELRMDDMDGPVSYTHLRNSKKETVLAGIPGICKRSYL